MFGYLSITVTAITTPFEERRNIIRFRGASPRLEEWPQNLEPAPQPKKSFCSKEIDLEGYSISDTSYADRLMMS